jgi:GTPase SAR1 family protein
MATAAATGTTVSVDDNEEAMLMHPTFEIKVALLGYVSAGKSTVLNAMLQGKYSEVAMRRTTAGVNLFRIHEKKKIATTTTTTTAAASSAASLDSAASNKENQSAVDSYHSHHSEGR